MSPYLMYRLVTGVLGAAAVIVPFVLYLSGNLPLPSASLLCDFLLGLVFLGIAVVALINGGFWWGAHGGTSAKGQWISAKDNPAFFKGVVAIGLILAAVLLGLSLIQVIHPDTPGVLDLLIKGLEWRKNRQLNRYYETSQS